ncbi:MAG: GNAT family N-acetyltransferase [Novosphingobium sp.]
MERPLTFIEDDLAGREVVALLELHLQEMHAWSPPCSVHAMPVERLRQPDVTFWSAWDGDRLAGCGALKQLDESHGELKSMRAHPDYRGKGVGSAMLEHLMGQAVSRGYRQLSLETGTTEPFEPARGLYASRGFEVCGPFADYALDPFSVFMTKAI